MEESKALHKLLEIADLVGMVEEMMNPASSERLSSASWSGMRITLRNVRDMVQASHATLSSDFVHRSRAVVQAASSPQPQVSAPVIESSARTLAAEEKAVHSVRSEAPTISRPVTPGSEASRIQMTRQNLKATLEKVIER